MPMPASSSIIAGPEWFRFSDMIRGCWCGSAVGADGDDGGGWIQRQQEQSLTSVQGEDGLGRLPDLVALPSFRVGSIPGDCLRRL